MLFYLSLPALFQGGICMPICACGPTSVCVCVVVGGRGLACLPNPLFVFGHAVCLRVCATACVCTLCVKEGMMCDVCWQPGSSVCCLPGFKMLMSKIFTIRIRSLPVSLWTHEHIFLFSSSSGLNQRFCMYTVHLPLFLLCYFWTCVVLVCAALYFVSLTVSVLVLCSC